MAAAFENGKIILPYAAARDLGEYQEDPRPLVDVFVSEHHGLGKESHDDTVMGHWIGDVWKRRFIAFETLQRTRKNKKAKAPFLVEQAKPAA